MSNLTSIVAMYCKELSDEELATLNLIAQLDQNPHGHLFDYEQVKDLFTIGGIKMHDESKLALARIVNERLGE